MSVDERHSNPSEPTIGLPWFLESGQYELEVRHIQPRVDASGFTGVVVGISGAGEAKIRDSIIGQRVCFWDSELWFPEGNGTLLP